MNFIGNASIPFFGVVQKGVQAAASDLHVTATFQGPPCPNGQCSIVSQVQLLNAEIAAHPAGIAVQFNDPKALTKPILNALAQGTHIVLVNVQNLSPQTDPTIKGLAYVGQDEFTTGVSEANNLLPHLHKGDSVVCINPSPSQIVQTVRCSKLKQTLAAHGISTDTLVDQSSVPSEGQAIISGYLSRHPGVGGIVALNSPTAEYACNLIEKSHLKIVESTFDLSSAIVKCIKDGTIAFSLDQQPFDQGYMSVVDLYNSVKYGMQLSNVDTGSKIVNRSNVGTYVGLVNKGIGG